MTKLNFKAIFYFSIFNFLIFATYRFFFLSFTVENTNLKNITQVLIQGSRLDLALISLELVLICIFFFLNRCFFFRNFCRTLYIVSGIHIFYCIVNFFFFVERNQHVGELLLAYITSPFQLYLATMPFIKENILLSFTITTLVIIYLVSCWVMTRKTIEKYQAPKIIVRIISVGCIIGVLITLAYTPVTVKKTRSAKGWQLKFVKSNYLTNLSSFSLNQAIVNPFYELLTIQIPASLKGSLPYKLDNQTALKQTQHDLNIQGTNPNYPLLQTIHSGTKNQTDNIVILQLEGLTNSIVSYREQQQVMPYLNSLIDNGGVYFKNTYQSFNATAGSVFSTVSGYHKICFDEKTRRFTSSELNGYYGSLPHILGAKSYNHYFFSGFRQSSADFKRFMGNQGFTTYGFKDLRPALPKENHLVSEGDLGIYDSYFLKISAEKLIQSKKKYTAHLMTSTTHSPWLTPTTSEVEFTSQPLNAFRYLDSSIQVFIDTLKKNKEQFEKTLIIIVSDHTSHSFGPSILERINIPLIFFHGGNSFDEIDLDTEQVASHVDILPTVLHLLGGEFPYSGMGQNLFKKSIKNRGVISGTRSYGFFITSKYLMKYDPFNEDTSLYQINNDKTLTNDIALDFPDILKNMKQSYLTQYETAKYLSLNTKIYPKQD